MLNVNKADVDDDKSNRIYIYISNVVCYENFILIHTAVLFHITDNRTPSSNTTL